MLNMCDINVSPSSINIYFLDVLRCLKNMWWDLLLLLSNQVIAHLFLILGLPNSVYHLSTLFKVFSIGFCIFKWWGKFSDKHNTPALIFSPFKYLWIIYFCICLLQYVHASSASLNVIFWPFFLAAVSCKLHSPTHC